MTNRKGDFIQCYRGGRFYPLDPRPEEVFIEDIAHHLSLLCRFTGACRKFYSVAQHSVHVSETVPDKPGLAMWALLHDAPESYLNDISRPFKAHLFTLENPIDLTNARPIECAEAGILEAIAVRFNLKPMPDWTAIKHADNVLLATEARDLMAPLDPGWEKWLKHISPLPKPIVPWPPEVAKDAFLERFVELGGGRIDG